MLALVNPLMTTSYILTTDHAHLQQSITEVNVAEVNVAEVNVANKESKYSCR